MFELKFETINADIDTAEEIRRILKHIGQKLENGYIEGKVSDINGNGIGSWSWVIPIDVKADKAEKFKAEQLAMELCDDDSTFYFSQAKPIIDKYALRMFDNCYERKQALQEFFKAIVMNQRQGSIRGRIGRTSSDVKLICAEILLERYEEDMEFQADEMRINCLERYEEDMES